MGLMVREKEYLNKASVIVQGLFIALIIHQGDLLNLG